MRRHAFTLIELLVVISIIALLIALLLPALGNARKLAYSSQCLSNQKQVMIAWSAYHTDNKELLVQSWDGYVNVANAATVTRPWIVSGNPETPEKLLEGHLGAYIQDVNLLLCPADWREGYIRSYTFSQWLAGPDWWSASMGGWGRPVTRIDQIKEPSNTFAFLDEPDPRGRNSGTFFLEPKQYQATRWGQNMRWVDWPAPFHLDGNTHAFADGSAVFRRFESRDTVEINTFYYVAGADDPDLQYFHDRYNPGDTQH